MKILILGADGYLGWSTCMHLANEGHEIVGVDNFMRRELIEETNSTPLFPLLSIDQKLKTFQKLSTANLKFVEGDLSDSEFFFDLVSEIRPDCIIHYAEQPSAPYSMMNFRAAKKTLDNNLATTFNCIWAVKEIVPNAHIIKLGTMGEYGTPNIDIEEGWLDVCHNGRTETFLYPRAASSLYHTTKVLEY